MLQRRNKQLRRIEYREQRWEWDNLNKMVRESFTEKVTWAKM